MAESQSNVGLREHYLCNFRDLFKRVPTIPIGLLIDPLSKLMNDSGRFKYKTFDFEFFQAIT
jgi:hypothetical protein